MIDKVQKIREEVEKLRIKNTESFDCGCDGTKCAGYDMACDDILSFIDSMQEEPVAPKLLKDMLNAKTSAESLGISQEEHDRIVDECLYGKEPELVDFDNLPKEEPVSEIDFEQELYKAFGQVKDFTLGMRIAKRFYDMGKNNQEHVSDELEEACEQLAENARKHKAETSSPFFSQTDYKQGVMDGAKWQKQHLWKPADGDDLPIIDREVIALLDNGKVVFAHRPPEFWDGKDIVTGKVTRNYPKTYDKGGWNIPDVKWWLDCLMPKEIGL